MPTRFYLPATGSCPITPVADVVWDVATSSSSLPTDITKANTALASGTNRTATLTTVHNRLDRIYVSSQQLTAQTIAAATFSGATFAQEGTSSANAWWQVVIKVVSADGSTIRGTLYAGSTASTASATTGAENGEMAAAQSLSRIKNALATTSVTAAFGDRIQIEVGARWVPTSTSQTFFLSYGDDGATADLALTANSSTTGDPWVELSNSLIWTAVSAWSPPAVATTPVAFTTWSGTATAAGVAAATLGGFVTEPSAVTAAGAGAAVLSGFGFGLTAAGVGAAALPGFGFGLTAAGHGAATVTGFITDADAPSAAGIGAATVTGFVKVISTVVAQGVGGGTVVGTGGGAAITFVGVAGATTPNEFTPSTSSLDSVLPAGIIADDLILIACHRQQDYALTGTPTGYTLLDNVIDTDTSPSAADTDIFYRFADGSEGTTGPTFTTASPSRFVIHAAAYRSVNKATPFIAHSGQATASSTTSRTAPAITNTDARAWTVFASNLRNLPSPVTFTPPSGMIERLDSDTGVASVGISSGNMAAEWADTAGGAVATSSITYTATSSGATSVAIAWAAFLKPTAGATDTGVVVAGGAGHATVGGFVTDVGLSAPAGVGAASVSGPVVVVISAAGAGAASVAVAAAVVTTSGVPVAHGVGTAAVSGFREQLATVTAAGVGTATVIGLPLRTAPLLAIGIGLAVVVGTVINVAPPHIAVQATVTFNGISDAILLVVAPGLATLDDLGSLPDADVVSDGTSTATVLPVAPGIATVQTT